MDESPQRGTDPVDRKAVGAGADGGKGKGIDRRTKIALTEETRKALVDKHGEADIIQFAKDLDLYGGNYKALTEQEGKSILEETTGERGVSLNALRDRSLAERTKENSRLLREGVRGQTPLNKPASYIDPSEVTVELDENGEPLVTTNGIHFASNLNCGEASVMLACTRGMKTKWDNWKREAARGAAMLRELLFTRNCALCGRALLDGAEAERGLCAECAAHFSLDRSARCSCCGRELISETTTCISCKKDTAPFFDSALPLYPYTGRYRTLLQAYKFGAHTALSVFFAEKLIEARALLPPEASAAVWTPVPPRPGKIKRDGWDQIAEMARALEARGGAEAGVTLRRTLKRLPSQAQKELDRESRRVNLNGKIIVTGPVAKNMILFDDVFTTGSTLSACAQALKAAGAEKVWGLCLFYD